MGFMPNLSPLHWANQALTQIIYNDNVRAALPVMGLNAGLAVLLIVLAASTMKKTGGTVTHVQFNMAYR